MFDHIRQDTQRLRAIKSKSFPWYVIESLIFENGYQAVVLYRGGRPHEAEELARGARRAFAESALAPRAAMSAETPGARADATADTV